MNLHLWVTYSGDHTLAKLGAYFATSLPFDLAHAFGNVVFCLAFGPALVRALQRFRMRMEVTLDRPARPSRARRCWPRCSRSAAPRRAPAHAQSADAAAAKASLRYLAGAQNDDGGWGGAPGQASTQLHTGWTALGLAAAGRNPRDVGAHDRDRLHAPPRRRAGRPRRALAHDPRLRAPPGSRRATSAAATSSRSCCASASANGSFAGPREHDRVRRARAARRRARSRAARCAAPARWIARPGERRRRLQLRRPRRPVGDRRHRRGDPGPRGRRAAGGRRRSRAPRASSSRRQNADGGFPLVPGGASNAQSTAWAVQGLLAAGRDPAKVRAARATRSPTCARSRPPRARSATRAPAARRRSG